MCPFAKKICTVATIKSCSHRIMMSLFLYLLCDEKRSEVWRLFVQQLFYGSSVSWHWKRSRWLQSSYLEADKLYATRQKGCKTTFGSCVSCPTIFGSWISISKIICLFFTIMSCVSYYHSCDMTIRKSMQVNDAQ